MTELWQIQVSAYMAMGVWHGAIVYWEPDGDGGFTSTQLCRFTAEMPDHEGPITDVLCVLESAHCALTDAASAST
jgi:hypothetical protein